MSWTPGFALPSPNPSDDVDQAGNPEGIDHGLFVRQDEFDEQGPSGRELAFASTTAQQSVASATHINITGLEITFTVGDRPVEVEGYTPWVSCTAAATGGLAIRDGANADKQYAAIPIASSTTIGSGSVRERITTPGEYTRRLAIARSAGSGTLTNLANLATLVATLRAVER